jgi:hypothetical protein
MNPDPTTPVPQTPGLRITHDPECNVAYIDLADRRVAGRSHRCEYAFGTRAVVDFDAQDRLLGIELLDARALLRPEMVELARRSRPDSEDERILRDFAVLDRDPSKTARAGLESDLVRQVPDLHRPDLELARCDPALHVSAEVLGELGRDVDRHEQVRFAPKKARTGRTKDRRGCTDVRHGHPMVRSMSDETRFRSTAERVGRNEVGVALEDLRGRRKKLRGRNDEVRMQSSTSRFESVEDRAGSMTRRFVTDEVQSRSTALRFESAQDRAGGKKIRARRTQVRNPSTEVRFPSAKVRSTSGAPRRRSSKAPSQFETAVFSHTKEPILMANTTNENSRRLAVLNLPQGIHAFITYGPTLLAQAREALGHERCRQDVDVLQDLFVGMTQGAFPFDSGCQRAVDWMRARVRPT